MRNTPYYFEVKTLISQFAAAFNDIIINRYDSSGTIRDKVQVAYTYAPKQRVLHDLVNKGQEIKIPIVSIFYTGLQYDSTRVFYKDQTSYLSQVINNTDSSSLPFSKLLQPTPYNITINMSIICRFQEDLDQIISNFAPYSNPYIIISWKTPAAFTQLPTEIRTEVEWSGSINVDTQPTLPDSQKQHIIATTSFTIKGWLFPYKATNDTAPIIYKVDSNFTAVTGFDVLPYD